MPPVTPRARKGQAPDPTRITAMCARGNHGRCLGRLYLPKPDPRTGKAYIRCECPTCNHPGDRRGY